MDSYTYVGALPGTGQVRGVIEAQSLDHARAILASMHISIEQVTQAAPPRPLSTDDLYALNQQLILMVESGMPLEPGLRLLAADVQDKRLASTLDLIARETEAGLPLVEAFAKHQALFPAMYSQLVAAGLARGDLSLTLTDLSSRMEFQERIRQSLWKALAYPVLVIIGFFIVAYLICHSALPAISQIHQETFLQSGSDAPLLPLPTRTMLIIGPLLPLIASLLVAAVVVIALAWRNALKSGTDSAFLETWIAPLPVVGRVVKADLTARWCAAVHHGLAANRPLPQVLATASEVVGSKNLKHDSQAIVSAITQTTPDTLPQTRWLDFTVIETLRTANQSGNIAAQAKSLADHHLRMASFYASSAATLLTPALLTLLALMLGWLLLAIYSPLARMISNFVFMD